MNKEVLFQIFDICEEILNDIRDHLNYLNISVYKVETIDKINEHIEQLRVLMESIPGAGAVEVFLDFEAEKLNLVPVPGQCSFSMRVKRLLLNVSPILKNLRDSYKENECSISTEAIQKFRKYKTLWQSTCPLGSKRWKFLQGI